MCFSSLHNILWNVLQMCVIHSEAVLKVKSSETNPTHNPKALHENLSLTFKIKLKNQEKNHLTFVWVEHILI